MALTLKTTLSGTFLAQSGKCVAFIPNDLPPRDLTITPALQASMSAADRALGSLDGPLQTLPYPDLIVLTKPALCVSCYFRANREMYYELLQKTRDPGDWETWLEFFLRGISEVSNEAINTAREVAD